MTELSLAAIDRIDNLPTLPQVVVEVNRLMQDPDVSLQQVGELIEKDLALAPRILKLVNSSFFGLSTRISSISRAVVLLGFNTVRSALFSVAVIDAMASGRDDGLFNIQSFWKHSLTVAVISRYISQQTGLADKENAFTAGLLHDIGKIVLWQHFNPWFKAIHEKAVREGLPLFRIEDQEGDFSHAAIGAHLAQKWQLPEVLCRAIRFHHRPTRDANAAPEGIIHVADILSHCVADNNNSYRLEEAAVDVNDPPWAVVKDVHQWYPAIADEIEEACQFFLKG